MDKYAYDVDTDDFYFKDLHAKIMDAFKQERDKFKTKKARCQFYQECSLKSPAQE